MIAGGQGWCCSLLSRKLQKSRVRKNSHGIRVTVMMLPYHQNRVSVMMLLLVSRKLLIKEYYKKKISMIAGRQWWCCSLLVLIREVVIGKLPWYQRWRWCCFWIRPALSIELVHARTVSQEVQSWVNGWRTFNLMQGQGPSVVLTQHSVVSFIALCLKGTVLAV